MKKHYWLILILLLAFGLRFYQLGQIPSSLEWDEVAIGYDAYSILKTGRDQFGKLLPLIFRSLDDYKPPFYEYLAILPIALFGPTGFAVRFPSAFLGTLTVLVTYLLVKEIFKKAKFKGFGREIRAEPLALLSAFLLSISPWHLQFSRAAFEVNIALFMLTLAVFCFYRGLEKPKYFYYAALLFGSGLFSYHSARVVFPLILGSLFLIFQKKLLPKYKKEILISGLIFFLFFLAFLPIMFSPQAQIRFLATNDLDLEKAKATSAAMILMDQQAGDYFWGRVFHNRRIALFNYENLTRGVKKHLSHFDPEFLFVKGDAPIHHPPGFGLLYFWEAPFLILGILSFLFLFLKRRTLILFLWLLFAPIPASVTWQVPHSVRTELFLPTFQVFVGLGILTSYYFLKKQFLKPILYLVWGILIVILIFNFFYYLHQYYVHLPFEYSKYWLYGRKEAAQFTWEVREKYDKVVVSISLEYPHVFFLYYLKYDPSLYLKEGGTVSGGFREERNKFDRYEFRKFDYPTERLEGNYLFVGKPEEFPDNAKVIKTIRYLDGEEAIRIATS